MNFEILCRIPPIVAFRHSPVNRLTHCRTSLGQLKYIYQWQDSCAIADLLKEGDDRVPRGAVVE